MSESMECMNCGMFMDVIERDTQGLTIGWRCPNCQDEFWPFDMDLPPEAFMEIIEDGEDYDESDPGPDDLTYKRFMRGVDES